MLGRTLVGVWVAIGGGGTADGSVIKSEFEDFRENRRSVLDFCLAGVGSSLANSRKLGISSSPGSLSRAALNEGMSTSRIAIPRVGAAKIAVDERRLNDIDERRLDVTSEIRGSGMNDERRVRSGGTPSP